MPKVNSSKDIYDVLRKVWDDNIIEMIEEFKVAFFNPANRVL